MTQYINKSALVAEIENLLDKEKYHDDYDCAFRDGNNAALYALKGRIDTFEVKEIGIAIPNIDDLFKEDGIAPDSKEAKIFKESYYTALEKLKEKKGE